MWVLSSICLTVTSHYHTGVQMTGDTFGTSIESATRNANLIVTTVCPRHHGIPFANFTLLARKMGRIHP